MTNTINIALTRDEALVFFEWLARFDELQKKPFIDETEQQVLWNIEATLESLLVEPFKPDYKNLLIAAKNRITTVGKLPKND